LKFLNVGCGPRGRWPLPELFEGYDELRMDIDPAVEPDVVGSITAMDLPDGSVDGVYASHILEHVDHWLVHEALCEVYRVLRPGGVALIVTPDLEKIAAEILREPGRIEMVQPDAPFGLSPLDMIFGWSLAVFNGQEHQRHRTAFTQLTLAGHLEAAGFRAGSVSALNWQLFAQARKGENDG
jgi:SAM-dependent methyltransferase